MEWLWPSGCVGCGAIGAGRVCVDCRAVDPGRVRVAARGLAGAWVLAPYGSGLGRALRHAKVRRDRAVAVELGALMGRRLAPILRGAPLAAVVPAPSTLASRVSRGFAAAAVLADGVGAALGVPVVHALSRRAGARQAGLDRAARLANLAGRVRCEEAPPGIVLLVDDVVTTGATADACVRELLGAGSRQVWLAALCAPAPTPRPVGGVATLVQTGHSGGRR